MASRKNGTKPNHHLADVTAADVDRVLADLVGVETIAERLGRPRTTVEKWRQRAKVYAGQVDDDGVDWAFPQPRVVLAKRGLWSWTLDIAPWVEATGRWPELLVDNFAAE